MLTSAKKPRENKDIHKVHYSSLMRGHSSETDKWLKSSSNFDMNMKILKKTLEMCKLNFSQ